MKLLQNADTRVGYAASFFLQNQENVRKKRIVQQISIAYNEITSCVVALREMEKKLFDILKIVQKNPVFGKTLMCGDMLDEERMGILYEILYAIDREEFTVAVRAKCNFRPSKM